MSRAFDIDGTLGLGAEISILKPAFSAALTVVFPNTAILVLFCLKSGKLCISDSIQDGLKKTKIS